MDDEKPPRDLLGLPDDLPPECDPRRTQVAREAARQLAICTQATADSPLQVKNRAIRGHRIPVVWPPVPPELN